MRKAAVGREAGIEGGEVAMNEAEGNEAGRRTPYIYKACRDGHTGRVQLESGSQ